MTGLIARQQCVGPLETPLADVAVVALSYWDKVSDLLCMALTKQFGLLDLF